MRLTSFTDYGLRVLMVLAGRPDRLSTIAGIAEDFGISATHLMKVALVLGKTDWVETVRGRNGGMRLAVDPQSLRLGDVVRALEPDFALVECFSDTGACILTGACELEHTMARAMAAFLRELDRVTLAQLVRASPGLARLPSWQPIEMKPRRRKPSVS
jgi:Rrf2 family transcriptional regulator, nitric oxide-sensitive transcriptional repressor